MEPVCDFCSSPAIAKTYACQSFEAIKTPQFVATSEGNWAACQVCADLIDHNCWDALMERSLETSGFSHVAGTEREVMLEFIRALHKRFRELRLKTQ